jgi:hypothetical protein
MAKRKSTWKDRRKTRMRSTTRDDQEDIPINKEPHKEPTDDNEQAAEPHQEPTDDHTKQPTKSGPSMDHEQPTEPQKDFEPDWDDGDEHTEHCEEDKKWQDPWQHPENDPWSHRQEQKEGKHLDMSLDEMIQQDSKWKDSNWKDNWQKDNWQKDDWQQDSWKKETWTKDTWEEDDDKDNRWHSRDKRW